ncbi:MULTISPECIES: putative holin-like toxin [Bacillus]|uniref:Holin-like toxin n=1 Tax=Bacillus cabrialesii subsp. tritici TaxID=2944916 RepID=A0ABT9DIL1_9BACI|nr:MULTISPECIES: putative holin-like toxin [Bacillus]MDO8224538.1 putative holin-like toxin [Bacillus cabrialesii subsp. tritici]
MTVYESIMVMINFSSLLLNAVGLFVVNRKRKTDLTLKPQKLKG